MTRLAVIALLASPAYAATLPAIQIHECLTVSAKDMARDAVERVDVCHWPGPTPNPFAYDAYADLKGWHPETPAQPLHPEGRPSLSVAPSRHGFARATAVASASSWSSAAAFSFGHTHGPGCGCCCVWQPPEPEQPKPVPLPASVWMLVAGILGLRRVRCG